MLSPAWLPFCAGCLAERIGDSAQGENKQWLLIVQHLQEKTLSWGSLSLTPSGFLLLWLPAIMPGCTRPQFCSPLSHMLSFLFWLLHYKVTYRHQRLMRFPPHNCTAATSSLPHFFPPSPPPQHHHPVPFTTSLYCHNDKVRSGAKCDTKP